MRGQPSGFSRTPHLVRQSAIEVVRRGNDFKHNPHDKPVMWGFQGGRFKVG
jgi:hypothetical protein